jgi:hypothetical protein
MEGGKLGGQCIEQSWAKINKEQASSFRVAQKESRLVEELIKNKTVAIEKLQSVEGMMDVGCLGKLQKEVNELIAQEDIHLRQRAKTEWLKAGDRNSRYFHACIAQRRRNNKISCIIDEASVVHASEEKIEAAFIDYYRDLFSTSNPMGLEQCLNAVGQRVTPKMNDGLIGDFTREEIKRAVDQMAPFKSPGLDGFPVSFYQKNWREVEDEVCDAAIDFFWGGGGVGESHPHCFNSEN